MGRAYDSGSISSFLMAEEDHILGRLMIEDSFRTEDIQKNAWRAEIQILKEQLASFSNGEIAFEFTIPRMGHRVDVVLIIQGIIFLLEFKVGDDTYAKSTKDQVMDYALDLKYFHEASRDRTIVPIIVPTEAVDQVNTLSLMEDGIAQVLCCNRHNIGGELQRVLSQMHAAPLSMGAWLDARYAPTPTIIEAAQALYRAHSVCDISRNDAGAENLTVTTAAINQIIDECKALHKKSICFITGVPGAGKTLAGLNIANARHQFNEDEHAVFLSGNGPLVAVLQEALARDRAATHNVTKEQARRETKSFIQVIHKFRDEALSSSQPPVEKVAIFDEAQRAWDADALMKFMKRKKGVADFQQSEPEFLISVMDRHADWAVIVCLIGGGQEINTGEAGIAEWLHALREQYPDWEIHLSDRMTDSEYVGSSDIQRLLGDRAYRVVSSLHLGVSLRSFRSERLADFVKALLDEDAAAARELYAALHLNYPIVLTRDLARAKAWVRSKVRGTERLGMLASSKAKRLRSVGIWVNVQRDPVAWFLNDPANADASCFLEVPATEFEVQGLEIDYGLLAWDADLRYCDGGFDYFDCRGARWMHVNKEQGQRYLKNAYRVLLTRARQGLVIFVPEGDLDDETRRPEYYDGTYEYLKSLGLQEI